MSRICRHPLLALALALPALAGGQAQAAPTELPKVRVLVVLDTVSDLKDQLVRDEASIRRLFRNNLPDKRVDLTVLKGKEATREKILGYYRGVPVGGQDGLVFFYGGHGAVDSRRGHYFQLQSGKKGAELTRNDLRKAMEARKAPLVVLLTDCCSNPRTLKRGIEPQDQQGAVARGVFHPTLRGLFYLARGTVDITAATGTVSWGDDLHGGLFTRSLVKMLVTRLGGPDHVVTWAEFFPKLRRNTETTFRTWAEEMRGSGNKIDARTQTPRAFALGNNNNNAKTWAVVSLANETKRPLRYSIRWSTQSKWEDKELAAGKRTFHALPLSKPDQEVHLEARLQVSGSKKDHKLKVNRFSGEGKPGFDDGWKYRWRTKTSKVARRSASAASALSLSDEQDNPQTVASAKLD